jgi:hypothetical protein
VEDGGGLGVLFDATKMDASGQGTRSKVQFLAFVGEEAQR